MKAFLQYVAEDMIQQFGTNLQNMVVVFPNKRANLFLNEFLVQCTHQTLWAPKYMSINDFFISLAHQNTGDHILLVCLLYRCYLEVTGKSQADESLDQFFAWGEILLADFDDVDKNLVDADKLFRNLKELRDMDADILSYLSEEQVQALRLFFDKFQFEETQLQQKFTRLWDCLGQLYHRFNEELEAQHTIYEGALYRKVLQNLSPEQLPAQCYLFVGFNVLDKVEEQLFSQLQALGKARFYWDYDHYYMNPHQHVNSLEAGHFLVRNVRQFGNALNRDEVCQAMNAPKQVDFISAATDSAQVRYVNTWLQQHPQDKQSAVVLCNEHLLEPVLHVLPDQCPINITMGFPMSDTAVFSFIQALCQLYLDGFSVQSGSYRLESVSQVLLHPYASILSPQASMLLNTLRQQHRFLPQPEELQLDDTLRALFPDRLDEQLPTDYILLHINALAEKWSLQQQLMDSTYAPLYQESLYKAYTLCNRLNTLVSSGILQVQPRTLVRFIHQLIATQSIPFHGEPAIGLQVMGVLETRNLNFDHVIMLSVNEGMLPKKGSEASFIPYNLRRAFGMTLIEQKIAVYAYYFYRILQRASHVTLLYNNNTEGLQKGEMSRFMQQYLVEHPANHTIRLFNLSAPGATVPIEPIQVVKTPEMVRQMLTDKHPGYLSASALNDYINCPLLYYFQHVAHLKKEEEITDSIDNALFGNIFHYSCELAYKQLATENRGTIVAHQLQDLRNDEVALKKIVRTALKKELFKLEADAPMPMLNGTQTIVESVVYRYLCNLLEYDLKLAPFTVRGLEKRVYSNYTFDCDDQQLTIRLGGSIDRLDEYADKETGKTYLRVVDYKTSSNPQKTKDVADMFNGAKANRPYHLMQACFYAMQVEDNRLNPNHAAIRPALFYITKANPDFDPTIQIGKDKIDDFMHTTVQEYQQELNRVLSRLYSTQVPFTQAETNHPCEWCDFKALCGR